MSKWSMPPTDMASMFSKHPCFVFVYAASSPLTLFESTVPLTKSLGKSDCVGCREQTSNIPNVELISGHS